ncbi:MAG: SMP-30/gluconolactonase/LRE family protein [Opitutales bacterium]|jgi:sugar lactone lactonase YvrE|nr:SMP-30/gluconolactonase/LRE family protein [Opitutales bacterium]MDP4644791.1 SMP-30/gluconolactonase/LRE family protein [Opitutales bacterium]MDP4693949.1 SMP-30/gluconolactonase/LRE family protein [Opitutales bacterium]MDP4778011.1 SMP-30/gluconolactonase/LRE family protein [Opitutales bacterium]MDP4879314.1 SMP-30/gluconolactonase/LRE family protein [Opitutales bacterium]
MTTPTITTIGKYTALWGETPIWWQDHLLYVDTNDKRLIKLNPETGEETVWEIGERIGTVVPTTTNDYIYAGDTGFIRFNPETAAKANLADPEAELRDANRFNDGKCDPAGRFWAGTISLVKNEGTANLYCLETDGSLSLKISNVTNSNGICWSADAKTMFYIDTPTKTIRAYDYNLASGAISNPRMVIDTAEKGYASSPDGMTIDADDNLWVAFCHGGCVVCFDPVKNKELLRVDLPCIETTACAFGGPNLDRLFVTTGLKPGYDEPDAGKLFVIDGLGIKGVPAFAYKG